MKNSTLAAAIGLVLVPALIATPAFAAGRTFVSGHGNDANPCTLASPCRSFAAAYAVTDASGEITVLDPAGYGSLTISKAISIVNDGVGEAGVYVSNATSAITIQAGPNDAVTLRGLTIDGGGVGINGIYFITGGKLTVQNCFVRHFQDGITLLNVSLANATMKLVVSNSTVSDNSEGIGIQVSGTNNTIAATLTRVETNNNGDAGILINGANTTGTVNVTISDSVSSNNGSGGIAAESGTGDAPTTILVYRSVSSNNGIGIYANGAGASVHLANSAVAANLTHGWQIVGPGAVGSYGDNYIEGNGANIGALSSLTKQ